ncbi:helix-turn-helix transcriptional regulator [Vibrio diazotrophicus]|uniref:helix-turn-helix transcriptional regulator n=1 Tax=Vibrio diazotrophicus TaxID=685 RepID=UPI000C9E2E16|nr:helix-turn-helix domain-containing protein [Vibrio diazotrophicus]PNH80067.1 transcriptional regulator [Vibrio diazotrophicus]
METKIVRPHQLAKELGVSTVTLWRWRQENLIPPVLHVGKRIVGWERVVIEEWLESKRKDSYQTPRTESDF